MLTIYAYKCTIFSAYLVKFLNYPKYKIFIIYFLRVPKCRSVDYSLRVDTVMAWLDLPPDERPAFINLYFDQPDGTGHNQGPFSQEVEYLYQRA